MNICSFVKPYKPFATVHVTFKLLKKIPLKIGSKICKIFEKNKTETLAPTDICVIQFEFN